MVFILLIPKLKKIEKLTFYTSQISLLNKDIEYNLYKIKKENSEINYVRKQRQDILEIKAIIDTINKNNYYASPEIKNTLDNLSQNYSNYLYVLDKLISDIQTLYDPQSGILTKIRLLEDVISSNDNYPDLQKYYEKLKKTFTKLKTKKITEEEYSRTFKKLFKELSSKHPSGISSQNILSQYYQLSIQYFQIASNIGIEEDEGYIGYLARLSTESDLILQKLGKELKSHYDKIFKSSFLKLMAGAFLLIILNIFISFLINLGLTKPLHQINEKLEKIGTSQKTIKINSKIEEILKQSETIDKINANILDKARILNKLSENDYETEVKFPDNDILGKAIEKLHSNILEKEKQAKEFRQQEEQQKWEASGIASIGAIMRKYTNDIDLLCENVVRSIIDTIDAAQGSIYLYNEKENFLELKSAFFYGKKRLKEHKIMPYEGILGTILVEKHPYYLHPVPDDYIFWETGMGYARPTAIFAFPLIFEDKIYGAIELASLKPMEEYIRNFLIKLSYELAITISYTLINTQTKLLLKQFEQQAKELKDNEKLYKKNQQHLKSLLRMAEQKINEKENELEFKEKLLKQKINELLKTEQELVRKEEQLDTIINEYKTVKAELVKENEELRKRIEELERRLNK